jgi:hypothetical protein
MWGEPIPTNNIPLFVHDDVDSSELPADKQRTPTELTE